MAKYLKIIHTSGHTKVKVVKMNSSHLNASPAFQHFTMLLQRFMNVAFKIEIVVCAQKFL